MTTSEKNGSNRPRNVVALLGHFKYTSYVTNAVKGVLVLLYSAYFTYALYYNFHKNVALFVITILVTSLFIIKLVFTKWGSRIKTSIACVVEYTKNTSLRRYYWLLPGIALAGISTFVIVDARTDPARLISAAGLVVIIAISFLFSTDPSKIPWGTVVRAVVAQLVLGLLILRWRPGFSAMDWLGKQLTQFLSYTNEGSRFVFGDSFWDHWFIMQSMPTAIYFATVSGILFYLGVLQTIILAIGTVIRLALGIGAVEAFIAASNIFFGPISASHLLSASVMSAPAALALAKILYPETQTSKLDNAGKIKFEKRGETNIIEAASNGASSAIKMVAYITANMVAFVSLVQFLNMTLRWFGARVGIENLSFQILCSYIFWPLGVLMGVPTAECGIVGELVGYAIFVNSFISYTELGKLIANRKNGVKPYLTPRGETIATYAVCNFANIGSVGMNLAAFSALAPSRRADLAKVAVRALFGGNMASFMTACVAGLLYQG